jgi:hemoglobin
MIERSDTIYAAIGGHDAVVAVVDRFYQRLTADPRVRHHFDPVRLPSLKEAQVKWFTAVLSGDDPPSDLAEAHAHLQITDDQVTAVLGHLQDVLVDLGVSRVLCRAVDGTVRRMWYARQF